jgi:hypothetical protein
MAREYEITAPDGRTFVITAPEGASQEDILAYAQREFSSARQTDPAAVNATRMLGQGLTLGFADEMEAGLRAPFSDRSYREIRDDIRSNIAGYQQENPGTALTLELGGGLILPGGALAAAGKAGRAALVGNTMGQTARTGAKVGAGTGAVAGAGSAPELSDIPMDAAQGATFGTVAGAAAPVVLNTAGRFARNVLDAMGVGGSGRALTFAERKMIEAMERDGLTPQDAARRLRQARGLGIDDMTMADLGPNSQGLGYSATNVPNAGRLAVERSLFERAQEEAANLAQQVRRRAGLADNQLTGSDYLQDLAERQSAAARQAYPDAYKIAVDANPFRKFADRKIVQDAYSEARKLADVEGVQLPDFAAIRNAQSVPTEVMHQLKRGLDQIVAGQTDALTGKMTPFGGAVSKLTQEINDELKRLNPAYAKANAEFADFSRLQKSYKDGEGYLSMSENDMVRKLRAMNPGEREAFRVGLVSKIQDRANTLDDSTDFTKAIFGSPKKRSALRYAFDDPKQYEEFTQVVENFKRMRQTQNRVLGGSPTAGRLAQDADAAVDPSAVLNMTQQAVRGNFGPAAAMAARNVGARAGGLNEMSAEMLSQRLFTANSAEQQRILTELARRRAQDQGNVSRSIMRNPGLYSGAAGGQGGLLMGGE